MPSEPYTPTTEAIRGIIVWRSTRARDALDGAAFDRWLAAHDALVRADEREKQKAKDAEIAKSIKGSHYPYSMGWDSAERIEAAIRSQTTQEDNR